jgi:hypothetical protein
VSSSRSTPFRAVVSGNQCEYTRNVIDGSRCPSCCDT